MLCTETPLADDTLRWNLWNILGIVWHVCQAQSHWYGLSSIPARLCYALHWLKKTSTLESSPKPPNILFFFWIFLNVRHDFIQVLSFWGYQTGYICLRDKESLLRKHGLQHESFLWNHRQNQQKECVKNTQLMLSYAHFIVHICRIKDNAWKNMHFLVPLLSMTKFQGLFFY